LPFDVIPRILTAKDGRIIAAGVGQRIQAINFFLGDICGKCLILKDGLVPRDLVEGNANYRPEMAEVKVRHGTYVHVGGIDIVRDQAGEFRVLEDNCRTPSGVSYVIENRHLMQRTFPNLMDGIGVRSASNYGNRLHRALSEVAPARVKAPEIVLLSPGVFNSAYFEHVFLAREIGVPLVEGRDLFVENDRVFMKTIAGARRIHVIYRRIDDEFLDPEVFRKDSTLGVPGLMRAYAKGKGPRR
jgi:uncharacterized circularly permuted ATP-grasp superfamily protein